MAANTNNCSSVLSLPLRCVCARVCMCMCACARVRDPGASLHVQDDRYFWFHHSEGDTMSVQSPADMDRCSALWAVVAYVVADLQDMLPR